MFKQSSLWARELRSVAQIRQSVSFTRSEGDDLARHFWEDVKAFAALVAFLLVALAIEVPGL